MRLKGQIEVAAVLIFVIIGVVAIYFVMKPGEVMPDTKGRGIVDEGKLIKDSVSNFMRSAVIKTIDDIYDNGGYADATKVTYVEYGGLAIPVWRACSNSLVPNVERELANGIKAYIAKNFEKEIEFYGRNAEFDMRKLGVKAKILKGSVAVDIILPTKVEGINLPETYKISIPASLKDVTDFASDFSDFVYENKIFENVLLFRLANPYNEPWLSTTAQLTECGKRFIKTRDELVSAAKFHVMASIGRIVPYTEAHGGFEDVLYITKEDLKSVNGRTYDFDVELAYPPSWDSEFERRFTSNPSAINFAAMPVTPFTPQCISIYPVKYSMQYPVIVSVKDEKTGKYFRFAIFVSIKENEPDESCSVDSFSGSSQYEKDCVYNADCDFNITVVDEDGKPIEGADVFFYGCMLGKTEKRGNVTSTDDLKIPCKGAALEIYKEGYRTHGEFTYFGDLEQKKVTLIKNMEPVNVHFIGVPVRAEGKDENGMYSSFSVLGAERDITDFKDNSGKPYAYVMANFIPTEYNYITGEDRNIIIYNIDEGNTKFQDSVTSDIFYPSQFDAQAIVMHNETKKTLGAANATVTISGDTEDIYIYIPIITETDDGSEVSLSSEQFEKMNGIASCFGADKKLIATVKQGSVSAGCSF